MPRFKGGTQKERVKDMEQEEKEVQTEAPELEAEEAVQEENGQSKTEEAAPTAEELQAALEKAVKERDEYLDLAQRQKAEFANYKRRTEGIRKEALDEGCRDTIKTFLPVLDNLERAIDSATEESPLREGIQMVLRQMLDTLTNLGVEAINPQGDLFDANEMNAVMQGTEDEGEPGTVCQVLQKGYKIGNHVIRHAMVKVVAG
ncbi:MAG: nucleotide exchange factor GrpE [Clostridia bacterium]|nr:nucleotide exchange factor GrpE [Clostridia bacterium]